MVRRSLLFFSLFLLCACSGPVKQKTFSPPYLEFRVEAEQSERDDPLGFQVMAFEGENVLLAPPHRYFIDHVQLEQVGSGRLGVHFRIYPEQRNDFKRWTGSNIGRRMAIMRKGKILAMPRLQTALPGEGIIAGNFSRKDAERIYEELMDDF